METGFLNKHDSEYFSTDDFEQSNDFESENSFFNVFPDNYDNNRSPEREWILPDEISNTEKNQKQYKEDFRKTFEDWQQHISSLQSRDEALKDQIFSPLVDDLPDIFGTTISIPIDKIKAEQLLPDDNLINFSNETSNNNNSSRNESNANDFDIKSFFEIDKANLQDGGGGGGDEDGDDMVLDHTCFKSEPIDTLTDNTTLNDRSSNFNKLDLDIKEESHFYSNSPLQDMPVLSPEGNFQPKQDSVLTLHPPKLEISGNSYRENGREEMYNTTYLGPDNYEVVEIKVEQDDEDEGEIFTEPETDSKPVIEATNLDKLLEQFEASASFKSNKRSAPKVENDTFARSSKHTKSTPNSASSKVSSSTTLSNKTIKDSLPKEVIDRIKDSSSRKRGISVVPAARLPAKGFNHMKDPGATKNKLTKLTNAKGGETVKMDHDYCNGKKSTRNNGERSTLVPMGTTTTPGNITPSHSDHSSKKDSGLESGDVSDCSSEQSASSMLVIPSSSSSSTPTGLSLHYGSSSYKGSSSSSSRPPLKIKSEERNPVIDTKYNMGNDDTNIIKKESSSSNMNEVPNQPTNEETSDQPKKKKKLNLEEYRSRRKNIKNKPISPIKAVTKAEVNGFRKLPENDKPAETSPTAPAAVNRAEVQTQIVEEKKEVVKRSRDSSKDRRSSRPLSRYRRRTSSSSSSSCDSRSRSRSRRQRRERSSRRRRYSSRGRSQRSRSRTRSSSSARSYSSSSSLSRSRSRNRNSKYHYRSSRTSYRRSNYSSRHSRYSQERVSSRRHDDWSPVEKMRQIEERRVIYVGQIEEGTTKSQLRERFETFGPIIDISLHFRERGDNYGFVTFAYKGDAYKAVEHGNDFPKEPHYDICFGGRRAFCKQRYSDLDGTNQGYSPYHQNPRSNESFDLLLREAQEKIRKQKHV
ncbi:hypothetical protein O3M35_013176 [Rhynocoris fuscipes]|uniref:RRM domain-containing protein n=1 Tax=Rhynocoris fuscipes TaxID=488301 RepID=A0AAW1CE04_9HEMI